MPKRKTRKQKVRFSRRLIQGGSNPKPKINISTQNPICSIIDAKKAEEKKKAEQAKAAGTGLIRRRTRKTRKN